MIYFIQGTQTKNIKIGHTNLNAKGRMNGISSSDRLVMLKIVEGKDERKYQDMFKHLWSHGEWFLPGKDLIEFINKLPISRFDGLLQSGLSPWERHRTNSGRPPWSTKKTPIPDV